MRHLLYAREEKGAPRYGGGDDGMKLDLKAFALSGGLFWGFIDGLAAAGIFGLLYNHFAKET
ncbi:hypothetical protein HL657_03310 [Methanoculleus sp. YWC-01]|jgi:hypothetical protein|uniref:Uncharacterized protein n=1 Tax=Methanoculleus nereidis TaxID=2735141 RepID=A0ABU3Z081_9EURY|nr:hypothetical protein [Methanoculleus sp. YWC-01]MCK9298740.1 hypothetical protein [Methanoculleus sp.]MDV4342214.1 hypothetical protein [Methanoculleus sp. YWC-01]